MYDRVLLAVAVSPLTAHAKEARSVASALAKGSGSVIHLLTVYDYSDDPQMVAVGIPSESGEGPVELGGASEDDIERIDETIDYQLNELAREIRASGVEVVVEKVVGEPTEEIVRKADEIEADLIVIGSHHKRNILDVGLGSHTRAIARRAPCPVVIVNPKID